MSRPELIAFHGQGPSALEPGKWEILDDELRRRHRLRGSAVDESAAEPSEVVVTDIRRPFWSMVAFMVKWSLASIPAFIILFVLGVLLTVMFFAMFGGLPR